MNVVYTRVSDEIRDPTINVISFSNAPLVERYCFGTLNATVFYSDLESYLPTPITYSSLLISGQNT